MIILTDIHGTFDTLMALLDKIPDAEKAKGIAVAGDLIDRGPKSMQVIQWCIDNKVHVARGNHEDMMVNSNFRIRLSDNWGYQGGIQTLMSYGEDEAAEALFLKHREWLDTLPYFLEFKDVKNDKGEHLLVTHSSAQAVWGWSEERRKKHEKQFIAHLVWGRPNRIRPIPGIFNVFGHTPIKDGPRIKSCYANIDTGCAYKGHQGYGVLTALQFPEMIVYQQENIDTYPWMDSEEE